MQSYQTSRGVIIAKADDAVEGEEEVLVEHLVHLQWILGEEVAQ